MRTWEDWMKEREALKSKESKKAIQDLLRKNGRSGTKRKDKKSGRKLSG